ncbi:MAG TPA: C-type lectin domain-containing protein [Polyangiaceae bacterium]|nr:C-type lectin domain-containing protein [Polyangiaceae bacterium]
MGRVLSLTTVAALVGCSLVYDTTSLTNGDGIVRGPARGGSGGSAGVVGATSGTGGSSSAGTSPNVTGGSGSGTSQGGSAGTMPEEDGGAAGSENYGCTVTYYVDADDDGYGDDSAPTMPCATEGYVTQAGDCNDDDPFVHPGLDDVCDDIDNDCDVNTEEECPSGCQFGHYGDHVYVHCVEPASAEDASAICASQMMRLVRIDDATEQEYVYVLHPEGHAWTGGSDAEEEGVWRWEDGEILWDHGESELYTAWGGGPPPTEPNNLNGNENCLMLNGDWNHWNDNVCSYTFAFSCERY